MTIDDVKEELVSILTEIEITGGSMVTSAYKDELKMAIDIMSKYQKIREIAFPLQFCSTDKLEHEAIMKICEVIEDGRN